MSLMLDIFEELSTFTNGMNSRSYFLISHISEKIPPNDLLSYSTASFRPTEGHPCRYSACYHKLLYDFVGRSRSTGVRDGVLYGSPFLANRVPITCSNLVASVIDSVWAELLQIDVQNWRFLAVLLAYSVKLGFFLHKWHFSCSSHQGITCTLRKILLGNNESDSCISIYGVFCFGICFSVL